MQTLTQRGDRAAGAGAGAAGTGTGATLTATTLTKLTKSNNNHNNNNLTLALMKTTTKSNEKSKIYKRRRRRQCSQQSNSSNNISRTAATTFRRTFRRNCLTLTLLLLTTTCSLCSVAIAASTTSSSSSSSGSGSGSGSGSSNSDSEMSNANSVLSSAASIGGYVVPLSPCAPQHWWDPLQDKCMPCTSCQGEMIPLRPCQLHIDTVCGSIYDLKIDWVVLAKTEPNWKERRKSSEYEHFDQSTPLQHLSHEQLQQLHEEAAAALPLDWQTGALFIAVLACLLFFSVAACTLIHHMRQWRRMERRLDQDVEELSTKLMAKLAEVQSMDGGTFFIGNADALRALPATAAQSGIFQPQHVLLPAEKPVKHHERRILKTLQPGNVYIEENNGIGGVGMGFSSKG